MLHTCDIKHQPAILGMGKLLNHFNCVDEIYALLWVLQRATGVIFVCRSLISSDSFELLAQVHSTLSMDHVIFCSGGT
jgi:hypothetical protein